MTAFNMYQNMSFLVLNITYKYSQPVTPHFGAKQSTLGDMFCGQDPSGLMRVHFKI